MKLQMHARLQSEKTSVDTLAGMKNLMKYLMIVAILGFGLAACNPNETDNAAEDAGQAVENAADNVGDAVGDAADNAGDAVGDAADDTQDAAQDATDGN